MMDRECRRLSPLINTDNTSIITNESSTTEKKVRRCFKPRYSLRRVKNRGAILILIWSYCISSLYFYISYNASRVYSYLVVAMIQISVGFMLPLAGWLADIRFGRYKVICFSMRTMWISSLLLTASLILQSLDLHNLSKVLHIFLVPLALGYGVFQANVIQFGVDQLCDASSSEIKTFITWYSWTLVSSVATVSTACLYIGEEYRLLVHLLVCLKLTLAVSLGILFNNVLIKEPVTQNPFKIVYGVIKYAMKHKSPRLRSAFTYTGEEGLPSRIDFGKSKYGGPFTTEQVEDVKTLFRVVLVFVIGCAFFGMTTEERSIPNNLRNTFIGALSHTPEYVFNNFYSITGLVLVPLYEIVVHPLFHSCLPILQSHVKVFIGFTLRIVRDAIMLALTTYARQHYVHITSSSNATLSCIFYKSYDHLNYLSETLDYRWIIVLEALVAISELLIAIGALEFYCAQVPYSMKGLVAGILYGLLGFFMMFSQGLLLPFTMTSLEWGMGTLSCGFWYLLTLLIYLLIVMAALVIVMRWYKKRKREDVLPNEQIFAERYYSRNV
jgi:peptide/histidine transporter 3/4